MAAIPIPGIDTPTYQSWAAAVANRINKPPMVKLVDNGFAVPSGAFTVVTWGAKVYDTAAMTMPTPTTQIKIMESGVYHVDLGFEFQSTGGGGMRYVDIFKNGAVMNPNPSALCGQVGAAAMVVNVSVDLLVVVNDVFTVRAYQDSGATLGSNAQWSVRKVAETPT